MQRKKTWFTRYLLGLFVVLSMSVNAHEFWMVAHDNNTQIDKKVLFELRIGSGWPGEKTPRIPNLINSFKAWDKKGQYDVSGHDGTFVLGHVKPRVSGATVIALHTNPAQLNLPADEFEEYLKEEGLDKIIQDRADTGQSDLPDLEYFSRSAKTILIANNNSEGFDKEVGLPLELTPLTDPLKWQKGTKFELQLLLDGQPLADTQVKAQVQSDPTVKLITRTDNDGKVSVQLPDSGLWLFSAVDMKRADIPDVDWQSVWASLSVEVGNND